MTFKEYVKARGLTIRLVSQKAGMTRQAIENYGKKFTPTVKTLQKLADAMTELGAETKVVDLVPIFYCGGN